EPEVPVEALFTGEHYLDQVELSMEGWETIMTTDMEEPVEGSWHPYAPHQELAAHGVRIRFNARTHYVEEVPDKVPDAFWLFA
ncbi:MAG: hypothetical protein AB1758_05315, partial [Candidatus Eremiobacterota bacterium]